MALLSRARGDLFQVLLPEDFVPEPISTIWQPYIERMPTIIDNVEDFIMESIQGVEVPPVNYEPVEQKQQDTKTHAQVTRSHKSPMHSQDLPEKNLSITFRMTDGYANYFILKQMLMWRFEHDNKPPYVDWLKLAITDIDGFVMTQEEYFDLNFRGISRYNISYSDVQQDFRTFDCEFSFTSSDFKYPGET